jgi:type II secretory pathway pseudopilin PulG
MITRVLKAVGRDERGYTMVAMLALLVISIAVIGGALAAALSANHAAGRNARVRRAQQAADAGVQAQLYEQSQTDLGSSAYNFNGGLIGTGNFLDCSVPQVNTSLQITGIANVAANSSGVCPQAWSSGNNSSTTLNQPVGDHTSYQSEMITGQTNLLNGTTISGQNGAAERELFPKIVSVGTETSAVPAGSNTVYSREEAILAPIAPLQAIEGEHDVKICGLSLAGLCAVAALNGDVLATHNLTTPAVLTGLKLTTGSSLLATLAYGNSYSGGLSVANLQKVSPSSIVQRSPVTISPSKASCEDSIGNSETCSSSLFSCSTCYSASTDSFSLTSGSATLSSGDYVFCNFSATGGTVNISPSSASAPVRIFIDSPTSSRCASDGLGSNQGNFNDTTAFSYGLVGAGGVLAASGFQVYVVGNGTNGGTTVQIGSTSLSGLLGGGNQTLGAIVYAPTSEVTVNVPGSLGAFEGSAVGYDTTVNAAAVTQDIDLANYPLYAGINAFRVTQYIQCDSSVTSLTQSTSDLSGC